MTRFSDRIEAMNGVLDGFWHGRFSGEAGVIGGLFPRIYL